MNTSPSYLDSESREKMEQSLPKSADLQPPPRKSFVEGLMSNPPCFIGVAVAIGALLTGSTGIYKYTPLQQNRLMWLRIGGHSFAFASLFVGCVFFFIFCVKPAALGWHPPYITAIEEWKLSHGYKLHPDFEYVLQTKERRNSNR